MVDKSSLEEKKNVASEMYSSTSQSQILNNEDVLILHFFVMEYKRLTSQRWKSKLERNPSEFNINHVYFQAGTCVSFICFQKQLNFQQNGEDRNLFKKKQKKRERDYFHGTSMKLKWNQVHMIIHLPTQPYTVSVYGIGNLPLCLTPHLAFYPSPCL